MKIDPKPEQKNTNSNKKNGSSESNRTASTGENCK